MMQVRALLTLVIGHVLIFQAKDFGLDGEIIFKKDLKPIVMINGQEVLQIGQEFGAIPGRDCVINYPFVYYISRTPSARLVRFDLQEIVDCYRNNQDLEKVGKPYICRQSVTSYKIVDNSIWSVGSSGIVQG